MTTVLSRWADYIVAKPLRRILQNPARVVGAYVRPGMTVLDVGCGRGFFSLGMARMVGLKGRVVCVDPRVEAIKSLEARAAKAGLSERIHARVCSERRLEIDDLTGEADFALAFYVVHHAADVPGLMVQVHEALKPGGMFLIVEPRHHASVGECEAIKDRAQESGFRFGGNPRLVRDWAALFVKS
jgi:2-polyprenyl-3-methyl-5-hydroxy-6-metoxy-1,4-benzoquinol methylase